MKTLDDLLDFILADLNAEPCAQDLDEDGHLIQCRFGDKLVHHLVKNNLIEYIQTDRKYYQFGDTVIIVKGFWQKVKQN